MKTIILVISAIPIMAMTACSTSEMVEKAHSECVKIGYEVGSPEYNACVERGYRQKSATQDAAVAATGSAITTSILLNSLF